MIDIILEALAWIGCACVLMLLVWIAFPNPVSKKDMEGY
jgi:hypothetical protein